MKVQCFHGTGVGDIETFRTHPSELDCGDPHYLSPLGAWFSGSEDVAELFARFAEALGGVPYVYEAEIEFSNPRVYSGYSSLVLDYALNPLIDDAKFESYDDWEEACSRYPEECGENKTTLDMRNYLARFGYDSIVIDRCSTDIPIVRQDFVVFDPASIKIVGVRRLEPMPEFVGMDLIELRKDFLSILESRRTPLATVGMEGPRMPAV